MRAATVLVFGTFDRLHKGHEFFLRAAQKYGQRLAVIVARDQNVQKLKGKIPHDDEQTRLANVQKFINAQNTKNTARLGYADWVKHEQVVTKISPNVICLGYDQRTAVPPGPWRIIRLKAYQPKKYKSSLL